MVTGKAQLFRMRAVNAAATVVEDEDEDIDAWTHRWRRNEISFLGNRVEELERKLRRRTLLLTTTTLICLAAATALGFAAITEIPLAQHAQAAMALVDQALHAVEVNGKVRLQLFTLILMLCAPERPCASNTRIMRVWVPSLRSVVFQRLCSPPI